MKYLKLNYTKFKYLTILKYIQNKAGLANCK